MWSQTQSGVIRLCEISVMQPQTDCLWKSYAATDGDWLPQTPVEAAPISWCSSLFYVLKFIHFLYADPMKRCETVPVYSVWGCFLKKNSRLVLDHSVIVFVSAASLSRCENPLGLDRVAEELPEI